MSRMYEPVVLRRSVAKGQTARLEGGRATRVGIFPGGRVREDGRQVHGGMLGVDDFWKSSYWGPHGVLPRTGQGGCHLGVYR